MFRTLLASGGVLLAGATAAVYLTFSLRVMPALGKLADVEATRKMQSFNRMAVQPPFMICFFGAAALSAALIVQYTRGDKDAADTLAAIGGALYLAGFVLTVVYNVPLNDRLARVSPGAPGSADVWQDYLTRWTQANSVRAAMSTLGTLAFLAAILSGVADRSR